MIGKLGNYLKAPLAIQKGQGLAEYVLILSLTTIVVIIALTSLGFHLSNLLTSFTNDIP